LTRFDGEHEHDRPGRTEFLYPTGLRRIIRGEASDVDWSPNGRMLAFTRESGIYVVPAAGGKPRRILRGESWSLPAWAPDRQRLALVKQERDYSAAIYVVPLKGRRPHRLLPKFRGAIGEAQPESPAALTETEPAWSPNGRQIIFQAGDGYIVVASVNAGRRREIVAGGAYEPAWSPDGRLIAYQCAGEVCVTKADGSGGTHRLAPDGGDPSWAPDSRHLVFEHYLYGAFFSEPGSLSIGDVEGGGVWKLTFGPKIPTARRP
jgi:TolB protein